MGASRDFANEYMRLAANRMAALASAFHGSEWGPQDEAEGQDALAHPISSRPRREKVRVSA